MKGIYRFIIFMALFAATALALSACGGGTGEASTDTTDTTAPVKPTALSASAESADQINLSWAASTDNVAVAGYRVYRGADLIATVTGLAFSDLALTPDTAYSYSVSAFDPAGNSSPKSDVATATTFGPGVNAKFLVANDSLSMGWAFDGTNYLFGTERVTATGGTSHNIGAQLVSAAGTAVGSAIPTGRTGLGSDVAFSGVNYLLVWEDNLGVVPTNGIAQDLHGMFINTSGVAGTPFVIAGATIHYDGLRVLAFGGGQFLVTYTKLIDPAQGANSTNRFVAGRLISPDGIIGQELRISTGNGARSSVAFDGTNFFVVWGEDAQDFAVRGRLVSPTGSLGAEIAINSSTDPSDNPITAAFNGTNFLVVWSDEVLATSTPALRNWQVKGQLVSPIGSVLVGNVINIATETTRDQMATGVACNPANGSCLATWADRTDSSNWDLYGRFVAGNGTLSASRLAINTNATNQLGGVGFNRSTGKYLAVINSGVSMTEGGAIAASATYGAFIVP